ncbi:MAG: shikimate kinase [Lachnospiraceae bacterium]|nr:shikimate kinase [Lachnospiraceae bacterium]
MRDLKQIREEVAACDAQLARLLARRMDCLKEALLYKKGHGLPILEPATENGKKTGAEKERGPADPARDVYGEELEQIFACISQMGKKVQGKALLDHNIALIGFMGVGKSTVSHCLRDLLAMEEAETDAMVVEAEGMAITDIFAKYGEPYFRRCESDAIIRLQNRRQVIISCGGGAVTRQENVECLKKSSRIVLLTATPETILERVKNSRERPILNGHMDLPYITGLMEKRREAYEAAADITVSTDDKPVVEICEEIIQKATAGDFS